MSPTDDDLRASAIQTLMPLESDLDRALNGPMPNRADARAIAHDMRGILGDAERTLGDEHVEPIRAFVERAQAKTLRTLGAGGWDDPTRAPTTGEGVRVGMTRATAPDDDTKPLTDEEIAAIVRALDIAKAELAHSIAPTPRAPGEPVGQLVEQGVDGALWFGLRLEVVERLVADLRRLQGEAEELRRAAHLLVNVSTRTDATTQRDLDLREEAIAVLAARKPSDDWLKAASKELAAHVLFVGMIDLTESASREYQKRALAILRKHRDGKA